MDEHLPRRSGEAEAGGGEGAAGGMAGGKLLPYGRRNDAEGQIATVVGRLTALCLPRNDNRGHTVSGLEIPKHRIPAAGA